MTGDAGTPLTAKWQIIELDEAQGIGSVEFEDGFTLSRYRQADGQGRQADIGGRRTGAP